ncbi:uncharacterized protein A4U43_C10F13180 [Asparagus officinalis]|uniref:Uncharacterized protein n=1 Tax=Asparagus officinalis TaxID=4686 RepID=A0A5P1E734_ASPOF|nr:uncharacterized protein A4U43_C10F13180 [Asparagus officinalis]
MAPRKALATQEKRTTSSSAASDITVATAGASGILHAHSGDECHRSDEEVVKKARHEEVASDIEIGGGQAIESSLPTSTALMAPTLSTSEALVMTLDAEQQVSVHHDQSIVSDGNHPFIPHLIIKLKPIASCSFRLNVGAMNTAIHIPFDEEEEEEEPLDYLGDMTYEAVGE